MNSVEITVGHRWKDDVRHIHALKNRRPADATLDLLELRDIIDIVVDGTNLTAAIPEEAIFGFVAEVLEALVALVDSASQKAIIEFHHEPWELVLVPDGKTIRVSLYSIDRRRRVVARDLPADAAEFTDKICEVAEEMLTGLFRVSEHFSSNHQVRQISQALATLNQTRQIRFPPRGDDGGAEEAGPRIASISARGGLTLGYRFDTRDTALQRYRGEHVFDLHALLFDGVLHAEFNDQKIVLCRRFPLLAIAGVVDRTRQLFNQLESNANAPFELNEPLAHLQLEVEGTGNCWRLKARDGREKRWRSISVHPAECLDALVSLGELFVRDLIRVNPNLEVNQRLVDLRAELEKLRHWHRDLCGNNLYHDRPEDYLRRLGHLEPQRIPQGADAEFPWPIDAIHTLFPRRMWCHGADRIDFETLNVTSDRVVTATEDGIRCLDTTDGALRWHRPLPGGPGGTPTAMVTAGDRIVACGEARQLEVLHSRTGECTGCIDTDKSWETLLAAAHYDEQQLIVAGARDGQAIGFHRRSGPIEWRYDTEPGRLQSLLFDGPLVCAQSSEGVITALNPSSGETLWKIRPGGAPELPLSIHQGRIYTVTHDPVREGSSLHAIYPFTGRTVWQLRLGGFAAGQPTFVDQWMLIPVESHGQIQLVGIDLEAVDPRINWEIELSSAGITHPTPVLTTTIDDTSCGLVRTDRAELTCFDVADGAVRWQKMPASETLLLHGNLPLFRIGKAVVSVADTVDVHAVHSGRLLHTFSAIEAPEFAYFLPPFRLLFGERAPGDRGSDRLTAYSVEHFLAVVE